MDTPVRREPVHATGVHHPHDVRKRRWTSDSGPALFSCVSRFPYAFRFVCLSSVCVCLSCGRVTGSSLMKQVVAVGSFVAMSQASHGSRRNFIFI